MSRVVKTVKPYPRYIKYKGKRYEAQVWCSTKSLANEYVKDILHRVHGFHIKAHATGYVVYAY